MKLITKVGTIGALIVATALTAHANMFTAQITAKVTTLDISGLSFNTKTIASQDIVGACATANGIDPSALMLVYDDSNLAFEVVRRTNGTIICTVLEFDQSGVKF